MKLKSLLLLSIAAVLAGCCSEKLASSGTRYCEEAVMPYVEKGECPGAISIFYKDGVHEVACMGYADVAAKRRITLDDCYMQCSQTKGFCGVTLAILVEEGKVKLDDPVSKYLPEFATLWIQQTGKDGARTLVKAKNALTLRHVLNHTGGFPFELPNAKAMGGWSRRMPLRSVAATAASQPIKFEPGTQASYSNVGIDIGAAVIEVVTGKRWEDYLSERVFKPLGMTASTFWPTDKQLAGKIEMYDVKGGETAKWRDHADWMQRPYGDDRVFSSAGAGLWTTARDQLKFYKMLMNLGQGENGARILKEETVRSILAKDLRPAGFPAKQRGYSLGLSVAGDGWFGHGGAWGTSCMVNPDKRQLKLWAVQFCGNSRPWNAARDKAAERFFQTKLDNSAADSYTGRLK